MARTQNISPRNESSSPDEKNSEKLAPIISNFRDSKKHSIKSVGRKVQWKNTDFLKKKQAIQERIRQINKLQQSSNHGSKSRYSSPYQEMSASKTYRSIGIQENRFSIRSLSKNSETIQSELLRIRQRENSRNKEKLKMNLDTNNL
jgi:hypothetical protein